MLWVAVTLLCWKMSTLTHSLTDGHCLVDVMRPDRTSYYHYLAFWCFLLSVCRGLLNCWLSLQPTSLIWPHQDVTHASSDCSKHTGSWAERASRHRHSGSQVTITCFRIYEPCLLQREMKCTAGCSWWKLSFHRVDVATSRDSQSETISCLLISACLFWVVSTTTYTSSCDEAVGC